MHKKIDIKCAKDFDKRIELYCNDEVDVGDRGLRVSIKSNAVKSLLWVKCNFQLLSDFFDEMAHEWRGWEGEKLFASNESGYEGVMKLKATSDKLGHITISIKLSAKNQNYSTWDLKTSIMVQAGQLEEISFKIKNLFFGDEYT